VTVGLCVFMEEGGRSHALCPPPFPPLPFPKKGAKIPAPCWEVVQENIQFRLSSSSEVQSTDCPLFACSSSVTLTVLCRGFLVCRREAEEVIFQEGSHTYPKPSAPSSPTQPKPQPFYV